VVGEAITGAVFGSGWAARAWGRLPGRTAVDLIQHQLPLLPARAQVREGGRTLRLAFASDLHIGPLTAPALLDNAFARLAQRAARCGARIADLPSIAARGRDNHGLGAGRDIFSQRATRAEAFVIRMREHTQDARRTSGIGSSAHLYTSFKRFLACGSKVLPIDLGRGFCARRAQKPHTKKMVYHSAEG